jgi:malonyl-CoA/methylmalonyl-CoA synthetase
MERGGASTDAPPMLFLPPICGYCDDMNANLYALFHTHFAHHWDAPALVDAQDNGLSFRALDRRCAQMAAMLVAHGVSAGDRVVVQVEKSVEAVALYLGCLRLGAIFVPLNTAYTAAEVAYFLEDAEPKLFVSFANFGVLCAEAEATTPFDRIAQNGPDDIAAILYTSGTTGRSKGAMLSHENLASNALTLVDLWGIGPDDVLFHALPIFHVNGLFVALHTMFLGGGKTIFLPKFDPAETIDLMSRATLLMGVPTFYTRLLAHADFTRDATTKMRLFISGSAPLLAETHREFEARTGQKILERYGMTEAGMITSNPLEGDRIAGTVGFALPGVEIRCEGNPGVLEIKGPNVFKGYWRMPEKTAEEFRPSGWFITGDICEIAADGRVSIVGRAKDLIIAGGYNIYPKEIESVIDAVAGVTECAVIGVPHPDLGEAVVAVMTAVGFDDAAVKAAIETGLARFKHPRRLITVDELPRNAMGKVQKNVLRDTYAELFLNPSQ